MKTAALSLAIALMILCLPNAVSAADEFGSRFGNTSPAAFGDAPAAAVADAAPDKNQPTETIAEIEPAAGGEASVPPQAAKASPPPAAEPEIPRRAPVFSVIDFK